LKIYADASSLASFVPPRCQLCGCCANHGLARRPFCKHLWGTRSRGCHGLADLSKGNLRNL